MEFPPFLNDLIGLLASLYPDPDRARGVVRRANLRPERINLAGAPLDVWLRIVEEANRSDAVGALLRVAKDDFPDNVNIAAFEREHSMASRLGTTATAVRMTDVHWKANAGAVSGLERIIGAQPTFLPIAFLKVGLDRARSVALVKSPRGMGTGFLSKDNLLITNRHVIDSADAAKKTTVWFGYEKTSDGADGAVAEHTLDPDVSFTTSKRGDDWTAVHVKGNPCKRWGGLELTDAEIKVDDFVSIIQHPGGLPKQIALSHNGVVFADERCVQYLTDTMPGSSGAPVFDSDWRVVAIHRSGGWIPEPGTTKVFFRNEGVRIRGILSDLREHGLMGT